MKKMSAEKFLELYETAFNDVSFREGDVIKVHINVMCKIMEQYHRSQVNNVVSDVVIKCDKCGSLEMYQHTKTKDKCEDCEHIQSFL